MLSLRPHIHYYSDCPFFAGCENMLANFLNSRDFNQSFKISFSYRASGAYEEGLQKRVQGPIEKYPLSLLDYAQFVESIKKKFPAVISLLLLLLSVFIGVKFLYHLINFS